MGKPSIKFSLLITAIYSVIFLFFFLLCCSLVNFCLNNSFWAGDKESHSAFKGIISEKKARAESKHKDAYQVSNYCVYGLASNDLNMVPAGHSETRWLIFNCGSKWTGNASHFIEMNKRLAANDNAGYKALAYYFTKRHQIPADFGNGQEYAEKLNFDNALLDIQVEASADTELKFLRHCMERGYIVHPHLLNDNGIELENAPFKNDEDNKGRDMKDMWSRLIPRSDILEEFKRFARDNNLYAKAGSNKLYYQMKQYWGIDINESIRPTRNHYTKVIVRSDGKVEYTLPSKTQQRYLRVPSLKQCIDFYEKFTKRRFVEKETEIETIEEKMEDFSPVYGEESGASYGEEAKKVEEVQKVPLEQPVQMMDTPSIQEVPPPIFDLENLPLPPIWYEEIIDFKSVDGLDIKKNEPEPEPKDIDLDGLSDDDILDRYGSDVIFKEEYERRMKRYFDLKGTDFTDFLPDNNNNNNNNNNV